MSEDNFIYKLELGEPKENLDYAIRYNETTDEVYAKIKGREEFKTNFQKNGTAFDIYLSGTEMTREEYENF